MRAVQRAVGRRWDGRGRVGVGGLLVSTDSPSSQRASTAAARPPVDHIASIGDFGWDGMMAWRGRREEEKTAWHAMPGEGEEGPGAMMQ